jgi:hypothetical protein
MRGATFTMSTIGDVAAGRPIEPAVRERTSNPGLR